MIKKYFLIVLVLFAFQSLKAQVDVVGGMGISMVYNPSLNDYLDMRADEEIQAFATTVEFYGEVDYSITEKYQIGIEYAYSLFDFTSYSRYNYSLSYAHQKPSLLAYYVISGEGYKFKFGGGAGLRVVSVVENIFIDENFEALGFGLLVRAQGHTKLGDNIYANIGSTLRADFPGTPTNDNNDFHNDANINSISISLNLGISYFF